ncbi:MAG: hypothetical protein ACRDQB_13580, partial [Thermocrispum sp.]
GMAIVVVLLTAAFGGIFGLFLGRTGGLIAAAVVGVPLLLLGLYSVRRRIWLDGGDLVVRTWGTRRVAVAETTRVDLVITQVRGSRTVGLLIGGKGGKRSGRSVKVDLAVYQGTGSNAGGRELGVLPLRRLANALMNNTEANGMVFAELLVAQLRSEAKGDALEERPLYQLATAAPADKLAQRYSMQAISRFVASLD